jgi:hypothetical protein
VVFQSKIVAYDFRAFMRGEWVEKKPTVTLRDIYKTATTLNADFAIMFGAFAPLIKGVQSILDPVAYIMFAIATIAAIAGHHSIALERAKWASIGYLAFQYIPAWMALLKGAA